MSEPIPETGPDLILGLIVIFSGLSLYLASIAVRFRILQKEKERTERLLEE